MHTATETLTNPPAFLSPPFYRMQSSMSSSSHSTHSSSNVVGVHYRVGKKIGEGSFGIIYEGKSLPLPSPLAAKKNKT